MAQNKYNNDLFSADNFDSRDGIHTLEDSQAPLFETVLSEFDKQNLHKKLNKPRHGKKPMTEMQVDEIIDGAKKSINTSKVSIDIGNLDNAHGYNSPEKKSVY